MLFLVQTALCLLAALVLLITRHLLVVLGAGVACGFVLARPWDIRLPPDVLLGWPDRADRRGPAWELLLTAALLRQRW